ncbi:hypothetical protein OR571_19210 [Psychrobacillus sp. NEAU-3TGS]|uniref:hypothetical protein n=1 Tax=Psychrobacillus sp. NEAU-3TGS TaxID=2995412 RepID=UPI002498640D|nr:hypothetical protein [Psychrobacillus sp. NEAU-3TGS]MDI2589168.1 hypothetical protein [Psychrobacillus sp. NEAU-3TGS]
MKTKQIFIFILILASASLIATGCKNTETEENIVESVNTNTQILNSVLNYMEEQDWNFETYSRSDWEKATFKRITIDDTNKSIDQSYIGKEVFTVTIEDAIAAPEIFVDPDSLQVIGIILGE